MSTTDRPLISTNDPKAIKAAARLETLAPALIEIISRLREGVSRDQAYALTYLLRREIGYVVAGLGAGNPESHVRQWAADVIAQQTGDNRV